MTERSEPRMLSARQAAARLGVKVETIYAYVSRGLLARAPSPDGRGSRFDARAIERLARKRRGAPATGGLSVVLGTGITLTENARLCYRGIDVRELACAASYEAVAEWLWLGETEPAIAPRVGNGGPWEADAGVLGGLARVAGTLPEGCAGADRLRAAAMVVGPHDALRFDLTPRGVASTGRRLIAALVESLPAADERSCAWVLQESPPRDRSIAERLWPRLSRLPATPVRVRLLNSALVLGADHGIAASTLAARVAASVRADPCAIVAAGLATLAGPLHGAASAPVHRLLEAVGEPSRAVSVIGDFLRRERRAPGFGHTVYTDWDPRARILLDLLRASDLSPERLAVVEQVLAILLPRTPVHPNVDFALGALTWIAGMRDTDGETLFGVARAAGWIAHALEEYEEMPLRFRPRAHYVGPAPSEATR